MCTACNAGHGVSPVACSVLGMGLLDIVDYAAQRLLKPGALVLPARIHVSLMAPRMAVVPLHSWLCNIEPQLARCGV